MPVVAPIVAAVRLLLLQLPPGVVLVSVAGIPRHRFVVPTIAAGKGLTVTVFVATHPMGSMYVMVVVPATTPVTRPAELMVATAGFPELQLPPLVEFTYSIVPPSHTADAPAIGAGNAVMVTAITV